MTFDEGRKQLFDFVEDEIKRSGFWIFNKRKIDLTITRILQPYERTANFPLPEKISEPEFVLDKNGITSENLFIRWSEVCASGVLNEDLNNDGDVRIFKNSFVVILYSEEIMVFEIKDLPKYKGNLGHYVELYKVQS
jgi:hypothetical protein